jgi:hypothetical protein
MVTIKSMMLSCVIDAIERRDIATVDIPGAFMQADIDRSVHVKLEGKSLGHCFIHSKSFYCYTVPYGSRFKHSFTSALLLSTGILGSLLLTHTAAHTYKSLQRRIDTRD